MTARDREVAAHLELIAVQARRLASDARTGRVGQNGLAGGMSYLALEMEKAKKTAHGRG